MTDPLADPKAASLERAYMGQCELNRKLLTIKENMQTLKLAVKVLTHDLECSKRERDGLISLVRTLFGETVVFTREGRPFIPGRGGQ